MKWASRRFLLWIMHILTNTDTVTLFSVYDTQIIIQFFWCWIITCAGDSISGVSWFTRTLEAADSVSAGGLSTTPSVLCFTLVAICVATDQQTQLCFFRISLYCVLWLRFVSCFNKLMMMMMMMTWCDVEECNVRSYRDWRVASLTQSCLRRFGFKTEKHTGKLVLNWEFDEYLMSSPNCV